MSQSLRIVVADDDEGSLALYQRQLERLGHQVVSTATNGKELVEQCMKELPDLIVTDIKMPEMDGFEASLEIARRVATPIIVVSGHYSESYLKHIKYKHISACLTKPTSEVELQIAILKATKRLHDPGSPTE